MKPITLRLEDETLEELEAEADELGHSNRSDYLRWIIRNRPAVAPTTAESLQEQIDEIREHVGMED